MEHYVLALVKDMWEQLVDPTKQFPRQILLGSEGVLQYISRWWTAGSLEWAIPAVSSETRPDNGPQTDITILSVPYSEGSYQA